MATQDSPGAAAGPAKPRRVGFLPIETNLFDRIFIGTVIFVAIHLLWMRFLEASIPLTAATIISVALGILIAWRG